MQRTEWITEILAIGGRANDTGEQLPWQLAADLCRNLDEKGTGPGLLALTLGTANWGIDWTNADKHSIKIPKDPAGQIRGEWSGPPKGSGKHLRDYKEGGLGLAHFDSGALEAFARYFEYHTSLKSPLRQTWPKDFDFNKLNDREIWLEWFSKLVNSTEAQLVMLAHWLDNFWQKVWTNHDSVTDIHERVHRALLNSRIANSRSTWARRIAGRPSDEQEGYYLDQKWDEGMREGGEEQAKSEQERTKRQIAFAKRAQVVYRTLNIEPFPT